MIILILFIAIIIIRIFFNEKAQISDGLIAIVLTKYIAILSIYQIRKNYKTKYSIKKTPSKEIK
jgi:uncharacterized membrane-anchored protein